MHGPRAEAHACMVLERAYRLRACSFLRGLLWCTYCLCLLSGVHGSVWSIVNRIGACAKVMRGHASTIVWG